MSIMSLNRAGNTKPALPVYTSRSFVDSLVATSRRGSALQGNAVVPSQTTAWSCVGKSEVIKSSRLRVGTQHFKSSAVGWLGPVH